MSLFNYADAARGLVDELRELHEQLSEREMRAIDELLKEKESMAWAEWRDAYAEDVEKFLRATPSRRKQSKKWNADGMRPLLIRAALLQALKGAQMLEAACDMEGVEGLPYREALALAAKAADQHFAWR